MEKKVLGKKLDMSRVFADDGRVTPVTFIKVDEIDGFSLGMPVKVTGTSKGKGFTGVMKRWGFAGGPATHGQSDRQRAPGSIGASATPGRVLKGKKMAGRKGGKTVTIAGLKVVEVDNESKTIKVSGAVPGPRGADIIVRYSANSLTPGVDGPARRSLGAGG